MRLLITGSSGFVGRHLISYLSQRHEIFAVSSNQSITMPPTASKLIIQDLTQVLDLSKFPIELDGIIHLAQSNHYRGFPEYAHDIFGVNVTSTLRLLEYGRSINIRSFIFASTGGVYANASQPCREADPINLRNFYVSSKYIAEILVSNYTQFFNTVILRPFFIYGPTQQKMLIPSLLQKVINQEEIKIDGNPGIRINPIYIDDIVRVFEPALDIKDASPINISGDERVTITELVRIMEQVTGKRAIISYTNSPHAENLIGDNSRMKSVLQVKPLISLYEGIGNMALLMQ